MRYGVVLLTIVFVQILALPGCTTNVEREVGSITLEDALKSVGRGLVQMKKVQIEEMEGKNFQTGLMPSEAEVIFNVSTSNESSDKLWIEVSPTPVSTGLFGGKAGGEITNTSSSKRGNQITIRFRNIAFSKTSKSKQGVTIVEGPTDPEVLRKVLQAIKDAELDIYGSMDTAGEPQDRQ